MKNSFRSSAEGVARERLRRRYRPARVRVLFVGESPPASGRFFYQADSGLYRAIREAFIIAFPGIRDAQFLDSFRDLGCYLVDLCGSPVDRLDRKERRQVCRDGEIRLSRIIRQLRPIAMITVIRSIAPNVIRAQKLAGWSGVHLELPYPGRWRAHRTKFVEQLAPALLPIVAKASIKRWSGVRRDG